MSIVRESAAIDRVKASEKVFVIERTVAAREVAAEYVRTKKERYLRVDGIKYKWN